MPFKIVRNDITRMKVDVIVNTANELPVYSDGTDAAVYRAAGEEELLAERRKIGTLAEGNVAITPGFRLPAKFIIHAASPYYSGDSEEVEAKLRSCYKKSLELAYEKQCESIAFPLIATGSYGYPKEEGMRIALDEINSFLLTHQMLVYLVVFDETTTGLGQALYPDLESYIDRHYVAKKQEEEYPDRVFGSFSIPQPEYYEERTERGKAKKKRSIQRHFKFQKSVRTYSAEQERHDLSDKSISLSSNAPVAAPYSKKASAAEGVSNCAMQEVSYDEFLEESEAALKERLAHLSDTFVQYLMYLIESKGLTNAEVYKRAIITKQLFSKIKLNSEYHPDKATAMRLCVGAGLSLDETKDLLARAGYALSPCDKRDIIFSYFIEHGVHDMIEIDIALEEHGLPCFIE